MANRHVKRSTAKFDPILGEGDGAAEHLPIIETHTGKRSISGRNNHANIFGISDNPERRFQVSNVMSQYNPHAEQGKWGDDIPKPAPRILANQKLQTGPAPALEQTQTQYGTRKLEFIVRQVNNVPGSFTFGSWNGSSTGASVPSSGNLGAGSIESTFYFTNASPLTDPVVVRFSNGVQLAGDNVTVVFPAGISPLNVEHGERFFVIAAPSTGRPATVFPLAQKKPGPPVPQQHGPVRVKRINQL